MGVKDGTRTVLRSSHEGEHVGPKSLNDRAMGVFAKSAAWVALVLVVSVLLGGLAWLAVTVWKAVL